MLLKMSENLPILKSRFQRQSVELDDESGFFSGLRPSNRIADAGVILLHRPVQLLLHCRTWAAIPHIPSVDLPSPNYSGMQRPLRASCRPFRHRLVSVRRWTLHMRRIQKVPSVGHMNERAGSILKLQRRPLWMCGRRGVRCRRPESQGDEDDFWGCSTSQGRSRW